MAYSVGWGNEIGVLAHRCKTSREALALAEEHIAARRANVIVTDLVTNEPVSLDALRELPEEEAELSGNILTSINHQVESDACR